MNKYEIMYILDKDLTDENKAKLIDRFTQVVEGQGGKIVNLDKWGMKKFAYEINHKNEGYYFLMYIEADPQVPQEIERLVSITEGVVRCLIIKRDEFNFKKPKRVRIEDIKSVKEESKVDSDIIEPNKSEEKAKTEPIVEGGEYGSPVVDGVSAEFGEVTDNLENTSDVVKG